MLKQLYMLNEEQQKERQNLIKRLVQVNEDVKAVDRVLGLAAKEERRQLLLKKF